jgi:amidophosphoribosyltransferase
VAASLTPEQICELIGADSLAYISLEALVESTRQPKESLCRACFDGVYPIPLPEAGVSKWALEGLDGEPVRDPGPFDAGNLADDTLAVLMGGVGGADALRRP